MYPAARPLALTASPERCIQLQPAALCVMSLGNSLNKDGWHHLGEKGEGGRGREIKESRKQENGREEIYSM